jgi:murein L,D-transpeptidase YafK
LRSEWRRVFRVASTLLLVAAYCAPILADEGLTTTDNATLASSSIAGGMMMADKVLVQKSERRLYLLRDGRVLRSYRVALGLRPQGHKQQEGDYKTPEGEYRLIRRNPHSDFFLSMEISYPSPADLAHAQRLGMRPGGAIMLHGWPNVPRKTPDYYKTADWTDGCIAVSKFVLKNSSRNSC